MSTTLEIFTSIVAVIIAMLPVIKFLERTAGWEETDNKNKRIK